MFKNTKLNCLFQRLLCLLVLAIMLIAGCTKKKADIEVNNTSLTDSSATTFNYSTYADTERLGNIVLNDNVYKPTFNSKYTLTSYNCPIATSAYFIAKIYPASSSSLKYNFTPELQKYIYLRNDSLFLTIQGKNLVQTKKIFNINLLINDNGYYQKPFKLVYDQFLTNKVIAHKGAWQEDGLPENSLAALNNAIKLGCQGSEFDVYMTMDNVLVISHDELFQGLHIEKSTYQQLLGQKLSNGETIPTLQSFLTATIIQNNTRLDCEHKGSTLGGKRELAVADSIVNLVNRMQAQAWVFYTSFGYGLLKEIKKMDNTAVTKYLGGTIATNTVYTAEQLKNDGISGMDYSYDLYQGNSIYVNGAKANGLILDAWTINDKATMLWWQSINGNGMVTDYPKLALGLFK